MALTPGTRLGVYEVTTQIGAGGMGEVYRATDSNLKRSVAIKVLPASVAGDTDRLARFQREAEVLAALNHPNIGAIYGLEKTPDLTALIMELVEGDDLSQRLARGAIPLDEALPIAKQITDALEAAHEQGIIHRDLKPANIKVRGDGTVKVLDFGLAKALEPTADASPSMSMSPTITTPAMTQAGIILGTAAYMSPEQARGKTVDRRADVWAFGVVLFEMLTGQRAFPGEDLTDTLAAVVKLEPKWDAIGADVPARVRQVLNVCLQKDPRQRAQAIGDVRLALEGAFETAAPQTTAPRTRRISAAARALPWVTSAAALVFAIAWLVVWAPWRVQTPVDRPLVRLDVDLGADVSLPAAANAGSNVVITPDGTRLVYASGSPPKLFIRRLDQTKATELPGTQDATVPFVSPDGQWVGFVSGRRVHKISVEGGAVVPLGGEVNVTGAGARWGEDRSLFIASRQKLVRIPAGGGLPETVAESRNGELGLVNPEPLPGGKAVLFVADNPGPVDKTTIELVTLPDHERKTLVHGGASPRYLPTAEGSGHLVYVNQATLFAIPFDLRTLETHGTAVPVADDIANERTIGTGQYDVSRTGTLVYRRTIGASTLTTLQWVDATGKKERLQARPGGYEDLSVSPDGTRVALTVIDGGSQDVWVYDLQRDAMTRLTFGGASYRGPTWTPDGLHVVFSSVGNGIFQARADGASQPQPLTQNQTVQYPRSFTPDGKRLAYYENLGGAGGGGQLWTVPLADEGGQLKAGKAESFLKSSSFDRFPSFSPDGHWLAYESSESGTTEVYVRAFPPPASGPGGKWQISTNGGTTPRWSPSGHDLLYQSGDQILAASYTVKGDTFVVDKPSVWIAKLGAAPTGLVGSTWDLARDGKRVVVVTPVASADPPKPEHEVVFVQNFFDELRRRVPIAK